MYLCHLPFCRVMITAALLSVPVSEIVDERIQVPLRKEGGNAES